MAISTFGAQLPLSAALRAATVHYHGYRIPRRIVNR